MPYVVSVFPQGAVKKIVSSGGPSPYYPQTMFWEVIEEIPAEWSVTWRLSFAGTWLESRLSVELIPRAGQNN